MSAPYGSEDKDDNFRELLIDRINMELANHSNQELLMLWTRLLATRAQRQEL